MRISARRMALCILMLTSSIPTPARAQSPAAVATGVVVDGSGGRVAGAAVVIRPEKAAPVDRILTTDGEGRFTLGDLAPGRYRISVLADGFAPAALEVDAPLTGSTEIRLEPAPVIAFVPVVSASRVTELRESLNTRVEVVGRATLEDSGDQSVAEVLRDVPGVMTRRGSETAGGAGEQIQGIDSRQVLVLLDGQPLVGARGIKRGAINLDRQSVFALERVEVVKGSASALYGSDAIGGVVSLISREPSNAAETSGLVSGSPEAFDAAVSAAFRKSRLSGLFSVEHHQHDGFDLTPSTFDTTGAPFARLDLRGQLRAPLPGNWTLATMVNGYRNETTGRSNGELGPQEDTIDENTLNAGVAADGVVQGTALQARVYGASYSEDSVGVLAPPASTPVPPGSLDQRYQKIDGTASRALGTRQFLQGGLEWTHDEYAGINRLKTDTGESATTSVAWAQHRLAVSPRLTTTLGLRVDAHSAFGTAVSPKVAASARVTNGLNLRVSYGQGFRAPDLGQLNYRFLNPTNFYQVIGNPNLEPETAHSVQAGAEFMSSGQRLRAGVNVFYNGVHNLIESVNLGFVATAGQLAAILAAEGLDPEFRPVLNRLLFTYKNVDDATTRGAEVDGEAALTRGFSIAGAYTYLDAFDASTGVELTGRNRHQGNARLAWRSDRLGTRANLRATAYSSWIAARSTTGGTVADTRAPGFALLDLYVSQRIARALTAFTAIDNLTDSQDPNTGVMQPGGAPAPIYRPEIGRTFRFGLRWNWSR